jgi:hypothetical protein
MVSDGELFWCERIFRYSDLKVEKRRAENYCIESIKQITFDQKLLGNYIIGVGSGFLFVYYN